jgi:uncharacterized protein
VAAVSGSSKGICGLSTPSARNPERLRERTPRTSKGSIMRHKYAEIAFTPAVRREQERLGSRAGFESFEKASDVPGHLGEREQAFIAERDGFYIATVSETGWPYIQHRGGPKGFLRIIDATTVGFADFRGNRQYLSLGNLAGNDRVSLFLMDYVKRSRLKMFGRARILDRDEPLLRQLTATEYRAIVERGFVITVEAFDWNCSQHITPRYAASELGLSAPA